jgi:hypothetical protein
MYIGKEIGLNFNSFRTFYTLYKTLSQRNRLDYIKRDVEKCEKKVLNDKLKSQQAGDNPTRGRTPNLAATEIDTLSTAGRHLKFSNCNMYGTLFTNASKNEEVHELAIDLLLECMEKHPTHMSKAEVTKVYYN